MLESRPLPAWLALLGRVLDVLAKGLLAIALIVLAGIFLLMNAEIAVRYLLGRSTLIADEYAGYGFAIVVFAGLMYAHRSNALLRVELGLRVMQGRTRMVALVLAALVSALLAAFSAYVGYRTFGLSWRFNSTSAFTSQTPLWLPQLAMPVGFVLLAVSFLEEAVRRLYVPED